MGSVARNGRQIPVRYFISDSFSMSQGEFGFPLHRDHASLLGLLALDVQGMKGGEPMAEM